LSWIFPLFSARYCPLPPLRTSDSLFFSLPRCFETPSRFARYVLLNTLIFPFRYPSPKFFVSFYLKHCPSFFSSHAAVELSQRSVFFFFKYFSSCLLISLFFSSRPADVPLSRSASLKLPDLPGVSSFRAYAVVI